MQFNVSFDLADSPDLASLTSSEQQTLLETVNAAATIWSWYLTPANITLDLALIIDNTAFSGNTLAESGPARFYSTGATFGGKRVYDSNTSIELRTGQDKNGSAPDIDINLTVNSIRNLMAFKIDDTAAVPRNRSDALSVFLHEIGHGLGFSSFDNDPSSATVYDTFIQNGNFAGANSELAIGNTSGVPLDAGGFSHISESSVFGSDLMSPIIDSGTNVHISALDLGILEDIGVPVRQATSGADVMHVLYSVPLHLGAGNDKGYAVGVASTLYGEDGDDILYGAKANDALYGGNGDDFLQGAGGNDTLDGGGGSDIAHYSGLVSNYQVTQLSTSSFQVKDLRSGSPDGTDVLTDVERLQWSDGSFSNLLGSALIMTTSNISASKNQTLNLSSLFSVSGGAGVKRYQLYDDTSDPSSGHFVINGVSQIARTVIDITAAQAAQSSFVTGTVSDNLQMRAFDGIAWSATDSADWAPFEISVPANHAPVLVSADKRQAAGQSVSLASLLSINDPDGDAIIRYQLYDNTPDANSGHFMLGGQALLSRRTLDLTAAEAAQTTFVTGTVNDDLQIRAFDGLAWSAADTADWAPFTIGPAVNHAPVVTTSPVVTTAGQTRTLASLLMISDADGDAMTRYQLYDNSSDPNSGHFMVNGVAQSARTVIDLTAAQAAQTSFITGTHSETLQVRAFDGLAWSAADSADWSPFTVTVPANTAPVVATQDKRLMPGQSMTLAGLLSISDREGDAMVRYQLYDNTPDPNSGHFMLGGQALSARMTLDLSSDQAAQTTFIAGTANDDLQIRVFDGLAWSAADAADWSPFSIGPGVNHAPVLTTSDVTTTPGQSLSLASLISVNDADGDAMTRYQLYDNSSDPSSGHFVVDGMAQSARMVIDIPASQLGQTSFVTGTVGDAVQIRAFDGRAWSATDSGVWSPFVVSVS